MKIRSVLSLCFLTFLLGCSKLTAKNYNQVAVGMTYDQVTALIGTPARCDDVMGLRHCTWGNDKHSADVAFADGKVILFSSSNLH